MIILYLIECQNYLYVLLQPGASVECKRLYLGCRVFDPDLKTKMGIDRLRKKKLKILNRVQPINTKIKIDNFTDIFRFAAYTRKTF